MSKIKKHFFIIFFLFFYFAVNAYKIIFHIIPFYDWDEAIYAQVGREMVRAHSLIPLWQGLPWLDKPPFVPLFYGLVEKIFFFVKPEISLRLATLSIAVITMLFVYAVYLKASKSRFIANLSVVIASFISIFLQRSTAVNIDVFLLLGWLGYLLFFDNFYVSFLFLSLSVLGKTLVGFYPAVMMLGYYLYLFIAKKIKKQKLISVVKKILIHTAVLSLWYLVMLIVFGKPFLIQHIIETHFKRVTSSIEFHFGQRTFYLDLIFNQFGKFAWIAYASLLLLAYQFFKKKLTENQAFFSLFLLPWFIFLNLTKTKIFWYVYPAIPQFAFLIAYPVSFLRSKKLLFNMAGVLVIGGFIYWNLLPGNFFQTLYSHFEPHYYLAQTAKQTCNSLSILENQQTRSSFDTLEKMNLLITTSKWWGSHPSIVYYFGKKVHYLYSIKELQNRISQFQKRDCVAVDKEDLKFLTPEEKYQKIKNFGDSYLFLVH